MSSFRFDDVLKVHPTLLNIPFFFCSCCGEVESNKENSSHSIELTNKTDRIVAYTFWCSLRGLMVSPDANTFVGTILPLSTCSVTVTLKPTLDSKQWICIWAYVVKDDVKAENITSGNLYKFTKEIRRRGVCKLPVICYYTLHAANSSSELVSAENGKGFLLHDHNNNSFHPSNNKERRPPAELVQPTNGGYESTSRRNSKDTRLKPNFIAFSQEEIQDATNNFSESLIIGHDECGKVYKCQLDNRDVIIKIFDDHDEQDEQALQRYVKEKEVLEVMRHENLIHLVGTCFIFRALVYEYLPNGSLEDCLENRSGELTWEIRIRIVYEICTALRFLHANKPPLVHGDLKPHKVLLGANFEVKLAGFGYCHYLTQGEDSEAFYQTMRVTGTAGYMDPDYLALGKVTPGVDVYSFGKTVVRILTGKYPPYIFSEVKVAKRRGSFMNIVDPTVRDWPEDVVNTLARFALRSTKPVRNRSEFMENFYTKLQMILDQYLLCKEEDETNLDFSITGTSETGKQATRVKPPQPSNNKEMKRGENFPTPTAVGYGSTSRRKSEGTRLKPSFKLFTAKEIKDATNEFSEKLIIGDGAYGKVYRCQLDKWDVAVKILNDKSDQGEKEYVKEMDVLERMRHENLIYLMGTCFQFRALVYEYLPNGSLEDCLKDRAGKLTWEIRIRIVYEICTALRFLHKSKPTLVHGDLKPQNVLLDANFNVKLADFGLCRYLTQGENSKAFRQTMHVGGSTNYMDPDYLQSGIVRPSVDVYSLGKTVVKILTGKQPNPDLLREVHDAKKTGSFINTVDKTVRDWPENVVEILARFALKAIKSERYRPEFLGNFYSELKEILDGIDN